MEPRRLTSILREPHFSFRVREEAERILGSLPGVTDGALAVRTGGYRINTTLDYGLQQEAKRLVAQWVATLSGFNVNNSALVAIDSATGEIVSYVGSVDYYNREAPEVQGQFDVAGLGRRQPGSAFKPITYASAFKSRDATVGTMLVDAMTEFGTTPETSYRPTNADIKEHGPVLALDALRYSLNIPSVQMQFLVGAQTTADFAESLGIASSEYIMGQDPGLSLALGSVPVNLTNMTQAYSTFAEQGALHPATTIIEIRDRDNRVVYTREDNGPETTHPMTKAEAYLPALHPRGQHRSRAQHAVGRARAARHAGWAAAAGRLQDGDHERLPRRLRLRLRAGQPDDRRVDGEQQPGADVEPVLRRPLQRRRSALPLARLHGAGAQPAVGLERQPTRRADELPAARRDRERDRSAAGPAWPRPPAAARTITLPFLEGTVPPLDNVHPAGCLDLELYVSTAVPTRPQNWIIAADTWSDRVVNGQTGASGDPANYQTDPNVKFQIAPLYGESGFPSVCGERVARPSPTPEPSEVDRVTAAAAAEAAEAAAAAAVEAAAAAGEPWRAARIGPCPPRS